MPKRRLENALLPGVAILVLLIDRISKRLVVANLKPGEPWSPIAPLERWASLTYVTNTGVAFGLFPNWGSLFVLVAIAMATVIMVYYCHMPVGQRLVKFSLGLQLGGALGNLVDRLRYGYVIDFIDFKVWPVFNLADSAITVGVAILAYHLLRGDMKSN